MSCCTNWASTFILSTVVLDEAVRLETRWRISGEASRRPLGSIIGYEYEKEMQPMVLQYVWVFQREIPGRELRYSMQLPAGWEYKVSWVNYPESKPVQNGNNGWQWMVSDVKAIRQEAEMPPIEGISGQMIISFFPPGGPSNNSFSSWLEMGNWYRYLTPAPPRPAISHSNWRALFYLGIIVIAAACRAHAGDAPGWMHALASAPLPAHDEKTDAVLLYEEVNVNVVSADKVKVQVRKAYKILRPSGRDYGLAAVSFDAHAKVNGLRGWCIPTQGKDYEVKDKEAVEVALPKIEGSELVSDVKDKLLQIPAADPCEGIASAMGAKVLRTNGFNYLRLAPWTRRSMLDWAKPRLGKTTYRKPVTEECDEIWRHSFSWFQLRSRCVLDDSARRQAAGHLSVARIARPGKL
jgi:hypothetical protein